MGDPKDEAAWFKEFQELNKASAPSPSGSKDSNRRKHPRFELDGASASLYREGLLSFIGVGKDNVARSALDLSEGGVRLLLQERVAPGTKVRVRIHMEKYQEEIVASGVVRWCFRSAKNSTDYYAGVMFTEVDGSNLKKIALMKEWFTSPQFKAMRETRLQKKKSDITFPK
jgi:hypothetical protein